MMRERVCYGRVYQESDGGTCCNKKGDSIVVPLSTSVCHQLQLAATHLLFILRRN